MTTEQRRLVVIEDGLLTTMANSPQYVSQFPFLAALQGQKKKPGSCGSCSKDAKNRANVYNSAKAAIAGMDVENKRKLKQLLNAKEVRVRFTEGRKVTEKTF